jgi:hypothetical protein
MRPIVAVCIVGVVAAPYAPPAQAQVGSPSSAAQGYPRKLTAADLRERLSVARTSYSPGNFGPKTNAAYFSPDGNIKFRSPDIWDTGTWKITEDGLLCTKYTKLRNAQETCQTVYLTGPDTMESHLPNGTIVKSTSVVGNPEGL